MKRNLFVRIIFLQKIHQAIKTIKMHVEFKHSKGFYSLRENNTVFSRKSFSNGIYILTVNISLSGETRLKGKRFHVLQAMVHHLHIYRNFSNDGCQNCLLVVGILYCMVTMFCMEYNFYSSCNDLLLGIIELT